MASWDRHVEVRRARRVRRLAFLLAIVSTVLVVAPTAVGTVAQAASPSAASPSAAAQDGSGDSARATVASAAPSPSVSDTAPTATSSAVTRSGRSLPQADEPTTTPPTASRAAEDPATPSASESAEPTGSATPSVIATPSASASAPASAPGSASTGRSGPTIASDLPDYAPGSTVTLTGDGWQPGESVTIFVNDTGGLTWNLTQQVVADAAGRITLTFDLPPRYVPNYDVTATGAASGTARTTFTDALAYNYWLRESTPAAGTTVTGGTQISYSVAGQRTGLSSPSAKIVLTMTGTATFDSSGQDSSVTVSNGGKTATWTPNTLGLISATTVAIKATVTSGAPAGSITATVSGDGNQAATASGVYASRTLTVSAPVANTCSFANSGSGAYASQICWFDLTGYDATTATSANGQTMRQNLPGGFTLTYTIKASGTAVSAATLPTWSGAYLGNTSSGFGGYYGIGGRPALYQGGSGTTTLTLSGITLTNSAGTTVTGFALVGADAESTDGGESVKWTSDQTLVSIGPLGNACGGSLSWSNANKTATCDGPQNIGAKTGTAILYSQDPATFTQTMVGSGLQGVAFGVMVSGLQLKKAVVNPVSAADGFAISVTTSGGAVLGNATANAASGWTADTGQLYIISSASQTFTFSESPVGSTSAANYAVSWACTKNGAAFTPANGSGSTNNVTMSFGDFIACTITNTGPALTLRKSVDNTAGGSLTPADWTLTATKSGSSPAISEAPTRSSTTSGSVTTASTATVSVPPGAYALAESSTATGANRYVAGAWACTGTGTYTLTGNVVTLAAGSNATCTIVNTSLRMVTVKKTWINGVSGDRTDLVVNNATAAPGKATSTSNGAQGSWTDAGNLATATPAVGSTVTVAEVLSSANKGRYNGGIACVDGNNASVTVSGNGTFTMPNNNVTCTVTNDGVRPTISVWKTTAAAPGGSFPFVLTNTTQTTGAVTTTAAGTRTQVDGDTATTGVQAFTVAAFGTAVTIDEPAGSLPAGWLLTGASCTNGTTTVGSLTGTKYTIPASDLVAGTTITCDYGNRPFLGTATWSKVDAGKPTVLLAGSAWTLTGPSYPTGTTVTDCALGGSAFCTGLDTDPAAGSFSVGSLSYGTYTLVETASPAGFQLDPTPHTFQVLTDGSIVPVGAISDKRVPVPAIPLTGGASTDGFLIAGITMLAFAAAAAWRQRKRPAPRSRT